MLMGVTELVPHLLPGWNHLFLSVYDGGTRITDTMNHFAIETYDDYFSGIPSGTYESFDTPLHTVKRKTVYADTEIFND
jgi:hypothetical protein